MIEKPFRSGMNDCQPKEPKDDKRAALNRHVREQARLHLTDENRRTTRLYLDERPWRGGEIIKLPFQEIQVPEPSVLVFADDKPWANYGHKCRYLFYSAATGKLGPEVTALFPPYLNTSSKSLKLFHDLTPVAPAEPAPVVMRTTGGAAPAPIPAGKRHALLFQGGMGHIHMNDLEFSYRTLRDRYLFDPTDIRVLSGDGKLRDADGRVPRWPGKPSRFQMTVDGPGTRDALIAELASLRDRVGEDDLVFIHLSGHGCPNGARPAPRSATITCFNRKTPDVTENLPADDFARELGEIPAHRALVMLMSQCNGGGFIPWIKEATQAKKAYIASAASYKVESNNNANWVVFSRAWISAQRGLKPGGSVLNPDADEDDDDLIQAKEAFSYAKQHKHPDDEPAHGKHGAGASKITLGGPVPVPYSWERAVGPPLEEFYASHGFTNRARAIVRAAMPDVQKLVSHAIEANANAMRMELAPRIDSILAAALNGMHKASSSSKRPREGGRKMPLASGRGRRSARSKPGPRPGN